MCFPSIGFEEVSAFGRREEAYDVAEGFGNCFEVSGRSLSVEGFYRPNDRDEGAKPSDSFRP